jgi:hypothetical protein
MLTFVFEAIVSDVNTFPVAAFTSCNHRLVFDEILLFENILLFAASIYTQMTLVVIVLFEIVLFVLVFEDNDNQIPAVWLVMVLLDTVHPFTPSKSIP